MGAEQSAEATAASEEQAATKLQAITRGRKGREDVAKLRSQADYKGDDGSYTMRITLTREKKGGFFTKRRGELGIELDSNNRIMSLNAPASKSELRIDDYILEVDNIVLGDQMLVNVMEDNNLKGPQHELRIRRVKQPA